MRILYLLSQRPELTGSGVYVSALLACAKRRGMETALLAGVPGNGGLPPVLAGLPESSRGLVRFGRDLPFPVVGMSDVMPYPSVRWKDLTGMELDAYEAAFGAVLQRMLDTFRPDLVHVNHLWVLAALARRLCPHLPVIASCHGSDVRQFRNVPWLQKRVRESCARLDAVLTLFPEQSAEVADLYGLPPERIRVAGAGYDATLFHDRNRPPVVPGAPFRMLYAGKLCPSKGLPWLLRACELLARRGVCFRLELCGSGDAEQQNNCLRFSENLNGYLSERHGGPAGGRVTVHGNVSQERLAELMRASDVFVLPSFYEGLPLVLLEALACGCRLVATALPGVAATFGGAPEDLIRQVPLPGMQSVDAPLPGEGENFSSALADALEDQCRSARLPKALQQGDLAGERARLLRKYSWDAVFERVCAVYNKVLSFSE